MNLHNIHTIARYEVKLLQRGWLFRIFAILALLFITGVTLWYLTPLLNGGDTQWPRRAIASQMPFFANMYYSIAQSIIVIFLAGSFLKRDKKLDTAEVIYVRPMSNADYIIGKTWGIVQVFLVLNVITLLITAFFHLTLTPSPFRVFPYLFYILTISLPSLLFVLGLSFVAMSLLKNQAVTFIIMLGVIGMVFFYVKDEMFGTFDFFGYYIPAAFSDVTGHADLKMFLLQRFIYLIAGIGLICYTIALVNRLPHKPWKLIIVNTLGTLFILVGAGAGYLHVLHYRHQLQERNAFIETFNRYADAKHVHILRHDLEVTPKDGGLSGSSQLHIRNEQPEAVQEVLLYLNPALQVESIEANGQAVAYKRENQVIRLQYPLASGATLDLSMRYAGHINETVCYTDILEEDYLDNSNPQFDIRLGKRSAWTEERFTLLTPECLWYPTAVPTDYPAAPYNIGKEFTQYALTVHYDGEKTVLSQGEARQEKGKTIFTNRTALPGISLTIADYEKKELQVDSVKYEILYFKGHDFFSQYFTELQDTLPGVIRELKNDIELEWGRDYPFRKFVLAETPAQHYSYIRNWKGYTEYVMPEIVFVPERGILWSADIQSQIYRAEHWRRRDRGTQDPVEMKVEILRSYLMNRFVEENVMYGWNWEDQYVNQFRINAMLYNHTGYIQSPEYPILDIALNTMQSSANERMSFWGGIINDEQRANLYLESHSFKTAISDLELEPEIFYEMLKLKSSAIRNYVYTRIPKETFNHFLKDFFVAHQFQNIPFSTLEQELEAQLGINLNEYLEEWYNIDHSPTIFIKDVEANEVVIDEISKYHIRFKVNNPSDVDAVITTVVQQGGNFRGGPRGGGMDDSDSPTDHYFLPAGEAREIKLILDERPANISINTNISHNLPTNHRYNFSKIDEETTDTLSGCFSIDPSAFAPDPNEIIIDNEDSGFRTIASNSKHKLKDLFQKEDEDKYKNFMPWWMPSKWTAMAADYCYGETIQSAVYKSQGHGNNSVEWSTELKKTGYYEISIWNPKMTGFGFGPPHRQHREERNQTYVIQYGEEKEEITLDLEMEPEGWISLGNFYLPEGPVTISLNDAVSGSYVIADAVKLTRTN